MKLTYTQKLIIGILRHSNIPQHLAIIMDGNRRYAKSKHMQIREGHNQGFDSFLKILMWGEALGIKEMTVFAFSIENYNRSKDEVTHLMNLFRSKLTQLQEDRSFVEDHQVQVKICGDLRLCDTDLRNMFKDLEEKSKHYSKCRLNVCFSYNYTTELENAMKQLPPNLEYQQFIEQVHEKYYVPNTPNMLVRTSGERRLSNFLLGQVSERTKIYFTKRKWPELNFLDFCKMIVFYNLN